jgi:hypothetical protein
MDNLFLPRAVGSIETGPQNFVGTDVLNTSFIFTKEPPPPDPPGLLNSVLVSNAGLESLNGIFVYLTEFEDKQYYIKEDSNPDLFIVWFNNVWGLYNFAINFEPIYFSFEDVLYPWNVTSWTVLNSIYEPAPIVTKVL